ncbi:LapA family protein [Streptomyces sp. NPDC048277]|uniref:LapA family protein n=1 Tax=Streptomyces sp. NPDC048277 TaxID=3155027 RepID=UPI0033DE2983
MSPKTSERRDATGGRHGALLTPGRIGVLLLGVLGLVFVFGNTGDTRIRLLIPVVTTPLWIALLATGLIGAVCGAFFTRRRR